MAIFNENGILLAAGNNSLSSASTISESKLDNILENALNEVIGSGIACDSILEALDIKKAGSAIWGALKKAWMAVCNAFEAAGNWIRGIIDKHGVVSKPEIIKNNFKDYQDYIKLVKSKVSQNKYIKIMNGVLSTYNDDPGHYMDCFNNATEIISGSITSMHNSETAYSKVSKALIGKNENYTELIEDINDLFKVNREYSDNSYNDAVLNLDIDRVINLAKRTTKGEYLNQINKGIKDIKKIIKDIDSISGKWDSESNDYGSADKGSVATSLKNACHATTKYGSYLIKLIKDISSASLQICKFLQRAKTLIQLQLKEIIPQKSNYVPREEIPHGVFFDCYKHF